MELVINRKSGSKLSHEEETILLHKIILSMPKMKTLDRRWRDFTEKSEQKVKQISHDS